MNMKSKITTTRLVESGVLLALGFVLSLVTVFRLPQGGSVTAVSMLPIVVLAYKYGIRWGGLCGFIHGVLQLVSDGRLSIPAPSVASYVLCFLLDYGLAWAIIGLIAGIVRNIGLKPQASVALGAFFGLAGRFLCSFLSGVIIWGVYAPEGQSVALYSFTYNGSYMIPEMVITSVVGFAVFGAPVLREKLKCT